MRIEEQFTQLQLQTRTCVHGEIPLFFRSFVRLKTLVRTLDATFRLDLFSESSDSGAFALFIFGCGGVLLGAAVHKISDVCERSARRGSGSGAEQGRRARERRHVAFANIHYSSLLNLSQSSTFPSELRY